MTSSTTAVEFYTLLWERDGEPPLYLCFGGSNYWWTRKVPTETWGFTAQQIDGIINHAGRELLHAPMKDVHVVKVTQTLVVSKL